MSDIEITGQDDVTTEEMDLVGEDAPWQAPDDAPEDYMVKCNSTDCGYMMRRSDPHGCPQGHVAGFSYAGPIPVEEPDGVIPFNEELCDDGEPDVPSEIQALDNLDDDIAAQIEEATGEVCQAQEEYDQAEHDEELAIAAKKAATLKRESKADWLNEAARRLRKLRAGRFPDGDRYPMFDKAAKEQINGMFVKPEAVQPLPADDAQEFYRRKARDTRLADLGLPARVTAALEKAGYATVADIGKLTEASMPLSSVKGISLKGSDAIIEALADNAQAWVKEWAELHPEPEAESEVQG